MKRFDTSNKRALPIDYGRRPLVRSSDDETVHVLASGYTNVRQGGKSGETI